MASAMIFLLYTWTLLLLLTASQEFGGNSSGQACVFPFTYKKRTFYTCTNENDEHGQFWCATTGSYDKDKKWSYCGDREQRGNARGHCVFPFIYNGTTYSTCTTDGSSEGKLWCSLTRNYDEDSKWTYCDPSEPLPCVFPFIFKKKSYSACTRDGAGDKVLWCATTDNYDRDSKWKTCSVQEYEGNAKGQACFFPFSYKGRTFYTCTNEKEKDGRFWCATSGSYDKDKKWSYCADTRLSANSQGQCVFPFIYNQRTYSSCTTDGSSHGKLWCSLTSNYDENRKWTHCDPSGPRGNSWGPCVFPFIYNGKTYSTCTTDGSSEGKLWCSLTRNYDEDPKWTYCDLSEPLPCFFPFIFNGTSYSACTRDGAADNVLWCATTDNYDRDSKWKTCSVQEYEGNSKGQACFFPFSYEKQTFFTCTNEKEKDGRFWCATSGSYDKDKKWSYCADTRLDEKPKGPCAFPFIYNSKSYSTCTTDGSSTGKLWCSLTSNYDEHQKSTYCEPSEHRPCIFPFRFQKKIYNTCTTEGAADNILWCATTADYNRDKKWKACSIQEYEGNSKGKPCIFPFIYRNRTFYTCTNEATEDGRFWCATTSDYDRDKEWSYCADSRLDAKPKGPCVFPFIYKGKSYSSCTATGESSGKLWCSLTRNYHADPRWTYCDHSGGQS